MHEVMVIGLGEGKEEEEERTENLEIPSRRPCWSAWATGPVAGAHRLSSLLYLSSSCFGESQGRALVDEVVNMEV